jgi:hypothetical protein
MSTLPADSLINKLISHNDQTFESGLNEAISLVKRGDRVGLQAIKEAIISLSGQPDFTSYKPGLVVAPGSEYSEARAELLHLAGRKEFLNDPYKTQQLIAAFKLLNSPQDFTQLISDVYRVGGSKEAHALLLLSNEMWCSVQLSQKEKDLSVQRPDPTTVLGAAARGRADIVQLLSQNGADIERPDKDGRRPLWFAARGGHLAVVRLLIELGADVNAVDSCQTSALSEVTLILSNEVANVTHGDQWIQAQERDPSGHVLVVELLIQKGADVNQAMKGHYTPADRIRDLGIPRLVALLRGREKRSLLKRLFGPG